jgi:hypothetical protein
VAEHPRPDLDDPAAVAQYLDALYEQTTDALVTLYGCGRVSEPGALLLTYDDVRAGRPTGADRRAAAACLLRRLVLRTHR